MAKALLEKEVIFKEDLEAIFGKRKWLSRSEQDDLDKAKNGVEIKKQAVKETVTEEAKVEKPDSTQLPSDPDGPTPTEA